MGWGGGYVPSVNRLLFLMNVCTAFDNNIFWARFFWESPNNNVLISLRKLWWCKKWKRTVLCSIYKWQFKRKWEVSSLIYPQTNIKSFIILHRKRSYFSELQLLRNLEYKILDILSPTKKWPGILGSSLYAEPALGGAGPVQLLFSVKPAVCFCVYLNSKE